MTLSHDSRAPSRSVQSALRTLDLERAGISAMTQALSETALAQAFDAAVEVMRAATGRVKAQKK